MEADLRDDRAPRQVGAWIAAWLLLCAGALLLLVRHIESTLPYPLQIDEPFVSAPAARVLVSGSYHPQLFNYPSLPKYLAALGMATGFLRSASLREVRSLHDVGNVGFPYADAPRVVGAARKLFAMLSVITLMATALTAWRVARSAAAGFLAPLALLASPLFFFHSWAYLNVDIVGTCFVVLTLLACLEGTRAPSLWRVALLPGALAGLATASKYTLAVAIVPVLLSIGLHVGAGRRVASWCAALLAMVAAFLAAMPHSVLSLPEFLNGLASVASHYAGGHPGYSDEPGLPQVLYYARHFAADFGLPGLLLAVVGSASVTATQWRHSLVLMSYPVALLGLLVGQRVHFARNVLSLHPLVALFAACGVVAVQDWLRAHLIRRGRGQHRLVRPLVGVGFALLAIAAIPLAHLRDAIRDRTDSRLLAQTWIMENLGDDACIFVPVQLGMDTRPLTREGRCVEVVDPRASGGEIRVTSSRPTVLLAPVWGADPRFAGQELAQALNDANKAWRTVEAFGTNPVLVNYTQPVPRGDPYFAIMAAREAPPPRALSPP